MTKAKTLLFTRWVVTHYDSQYLNNINGDAWRELYEYFNTIVFTNYKKNGSYKKAKEFYAKPNIPVRLQIIERVVTIPEQIICMGAESNGCDCGQMSCPTCHG